MNRQAFLVLLGIVSFFITWGQAVASVPTATGITLDHTKVTLNVAESLSLIHNVLPAGANQDVIWTSSNPLVATVNQNSEVVDGVTYPPGTIQAKSPGIANIIASTVDGGRVAICEVTVYGPVSRVEVSPTTLNLTAGGTPQNLTATVLPANATNKSLNWVSSRPAVAQVNQQGMVTPLTEGSATIIVTTVDGGHTATSEVRVTGVPVTGVTLNRSSASMTLQGGTVTLTATVAPSNATNSSVTWSSSDSNVVRVSNGVLTPVSTGTATITVTTENGRRTATCLVTVTDPSTGGTARDLVMTRRSSTEIGLSWSGTTGRALVELRSGSTLIDSLSTSSRETTFSGLSSTTRYDVYINDRFVHSFTLSELQQVGDKVTSFTVELIGSTGAELSWRGTTGTVEVELTASGESARYRRTSNRSVEFTGLTANTLYQVYIDGVYIDRFRTGSSTLRAFNIDKKMDTSLELSWQGTSGLVYIDLRGVDNRRLFEKSTTSSFVTFTNLSPNTEYRVFINDVFIQTVRTEASNRVSQFKVKMGLADRTLEMSWSGTLAGAEVTLKTEGTVYQSLQARTNAAVFTGLRLNQDYAIYINDQYMETVFFGLRDISTHWAKTAIERLFDQRVVSGYDDGSFRPDRTVSREEFVTMLVQAKQYVPVKGVSPFRDVPVGYWAHSPIQTAIARGILIPKEYGTYFEPKKPITREEMAILMARANGLKAAPEVVKFKDQQEIKNKGLVGAVIKVQWLNGYPDQTFRPKNQLTRAEAATVINKIF